MKNLQTAISPRIFLLDSEPYFLYVYEEIIRGLGYEDIHLFNKSSHCLAQLNRVPDIVFVNYNMDNGNGLLILEAIKRFDPDIIVFFIFGDQSISVAVNAMQQGALDYIVQRDISANRVKYCMDRTKAMSDVPAFCQN